IKLQEVKKYLDDRKDHYLRANQYNLYHATMADIYDNIVKDPRFTLERKQLETDFSHLDSSTKSRILGYYTQDKENGLVRHNQTATFMALCHEDAPTNINNIKVKSIYDALEYRANMELITQGSLDILKNNFVNAKEIPHTLSRSAKLNHIKPQVTRYAGAYGYGLGVAEGKYGGTATVLYDDCCKKPGLSPDIVNSKASLHRESVVKDVFSLDLGTNSLI